MKRYVWVVTSPKGETRVFAHETSMKSALPEKARNNPKALDEKGKAWRYGGKGGFVAKRLPIEDSDGLPK